MAYGFALLMCAGAIGLEILLDRATGDPPHPFALSFFAILIAILWAGAAPGLMAGLVLVVWSALYSVNYGLSATGTIVRAAVFLTLSTGSALIWQKMKSVSSSETLHRRIAESAGGGIWVHDAQGVITYANERMARTLGLEKNNLAGRKTEEFFLPEDLASERVRAENLRRSGQTQFDRRLRRADAAEIWVLACCSQIASETLLGKKAMTLAIMTEITERKRAEFALRRSEERFRSLFEGIPQGVYQTSPEGRVLWANRTLVGMLGFANEEQLRSADIARDIYPDPQVRERLIDQLGRDGSYRNVRYELRRRDGKIIVVVDNAHAVRGGDGSVIYYEGVLAEISADRGEGAASGVR